MSKQILKENSQNFIENNNQAKAQNIIEAFSNLVIFLQDFSKLPVVDSMFNYNSNLVLKFNFIFSSPFLNNKLQNPKFFQFFQTYFRNFPLELFNTPCEFQIQIALVIPNSNFINKLYLHFSIFNLPKTFNQNATHKTITFTFATPTNLLISLQQKGISFTPIRSNIKKILDYLLKIQECKLIKVKNFLIKDDYEKINFLKRFCDDFQKIIKFIIEQDTKDKLIQFKNRMERELEEVLTENLDKFQVLLQSVEENVFEEVFLR